MENEITPIKIDVHCRQATGKHASSRDSPIPKLRFVVLIAISLMASFILYTYNITLFTEPKQLDFKVTYLHGKSSTSKGRSVTDNSAVDRKRYLCPRYEGRLGNIMFIYASTYGIAFDHNLTVVISRRNTLFEGFENIPVQGFDGKCTTGDSQFIQEKCPRMYENFNFSLEHTMYHLKGFLQSWKYFKHSYADIKHQFVFKSSIRTKVKKTLQRLVLSKFTNKTVVSTVGIHVRREDFVKHNLTVADKAYFDRAKQYFLNRYQNVLFVVATSPFKKDRKWCEDNIMKGNGSVVFSSFSNKFEDMAILTMTDHVIISVGTFSWWSGFLNHGTVIYFDWIRKDHPRFNRNDYVLPSWIGFKPNTYS